MWHYIYVFSLYCQNQSRFLRFFTYKQKFTLHNVIIHIKSVLNKDKNHYYYKIFVEKCSYRLAKNNYEFSYKV